MCECMFSDVIVATYFVRVGSTGVMNIMYIFYETYQLPAIAGIINSEFKNCVHKSNLSAGTSGKNLYSLQFLHSKQHGKEKL